MSLRFVRAVFAVAAVVAAGLVAQEAKANPPAAPENFSATLVSLNNSIAVSLAWTLPAGAESSSVVLRRGGESGSNVNINNCRAFPPAAFSPQPLAGVRPGDGFAVDDSADLAFGVCYAYEIRARNSADEESDSAFALIYYHGPPPAPVILSAGIQPGERLYFDGVRLEWETNISRIAAGGTDITARHIYRDDNGDGVFQFAARRSGFSYNDPAVAGRWDQTIAYRVRAQNAAGLGPYAETVVALPPEPFQLTYDHLPADGSGGVLRVDSPVFTRSFPPGEFAAAGSAVTFVAAPNPSFRVDGWSGEDGQCAVNPNPGESVACVLPADAPLQVLVTFAADQVFTPPEAPGQPAACTRFDA